jgi:FKBP-type peptidyl-prolyl cis-trans isomerase
LEDNIKQDICQLKIQNWIACVQDRGKWKEVVDKAKTFNQRKFSAWKKKKKKKKKNRKKTKKKKNTKKKKTKKKKTKKEEEKKKKKKTKKKKKKPCFIQHTANTLNLLILKNVGFIQLSY